MCWIFKKQLNSRLGPDYTLPGRNITSLAGTLKPRPDNRYPGRGKASKPAGPAFLIPAGPGSLHPGWPSVSVVPADRESFFGWASSGRPRPGWADHPAGPPWMPAPRLGRLSGWASWSPAPRLGRPSSWASWSPAPRLLRSARLGRIWRIRPGRDLSPLGRHLKVPAGLGFPWPRPG
jgi:hypothetical protein